MLSTTITHTVTYLECVNLVIDIILYYDYYYQGLERLILDLKTKFLNRFCPAS